jgi:colanic acid biosynthesis protein WcaH
MKNIPEETYRQIVEFMPITCVDLIIRHNNKILMVKRKNRPAKGEWWMPGGRILKNETCEDAAIRKAKEESGLDVKIVKPLIFEETIFEDSNLDGIKTGTHTINVSFLLDAKGDDVSLDDQSAEYIWADRIDESWPSYVKHVIDASGVFKN